MPNGVLTTVQSLNSKQNNSRYVDYRFALSIQVPATSRCIPVVCQSSPAGLSYSEGVKYAFICPFEFSITTNDAVIVLFEFYIAMVL